MPQTLTRRELNRATLARQMLLAREPSPVVPALERLLAMQAQEAKPPFTGLWSRLADFTPEQLHTALHARQAVRGTFVRATLHLMSAADYLSFRMLVHEALGGSVRSIFARTGSKGVDPDELLPAARERLLAGPADFATLRQVLTKRFPEVNDRALGYAARMRLPLVMVPTQDRWAFPRTAEFALAESWLSAAPAADPAAAEFVHRYLAAFGPASVADMQGFTGLTRLGPVFETMRPGLRVFQDERGTELFDVPDGPLPGPDTAAPARYLPEFDSLVLGHADRSRLVGEAHRSRLATKNLRVPATFLCDGFVAGTWKATRRGAAATLALSPFEPLPARWVEELTEEGERLLGFLEGDAARRAVRVEPVS